MPTPAAAPHCSGMARRLAVATAASALLVSTTLLTPAPASAQSGPTLQLSASRDSSVTVLGQPLRSSRQSIDVSGGAAAVGQWHWGHAYRVLELPAVQGVAADTNGDLHRSALGWQRTDEDRRLALAVVAAVSSNVLKAPQRLRLHDLVPTLAYEQRIGTALWAGLYADDSFGTWRIYPGLAWQWRPTPAQTLRIGLPQTTWQWQLAPAWQVQLRLAPDGASWSVRDRDFTRRSTLRSRAWQLQATLAWEPSARMALQARLGRGSDERLDYVLRDGSRAAVDMPARTQFGATARWRF